MKMNKNCNGRLYVCWWIDAYDLMHYERKEYCSEAYKYLKNHNSLIPSFWLAL